MVDEVDSLDLARRKKRAEYSREWRKRGAAAALGTILQCLKCACEFEKKAVSQVYCDACGTKRKTPKRRVGYPWACTNCGVEIIVTHPRNVYCDGCQELRRRNVLPSIRAAANAYGRKRRAADPQYALSRNMGGAIWKSLEDGKAGRSWETLVDYTVTDLMRHLERQFLKGMTWRNRSLWHIDHIQPLASFTFTSPDDPEFKAAWAITNLRPLWSEDNLAKNAKRTLLL